MTDEFVNYFRANYHYAKPYRSDKFVVRKNGSNKTLTPNDIFAEYGKIRLSQGFVPDVTLDEVVNYVALNTPTEEEKERVPCRTWITQWLQAHKDNWQFSRGWRSISYMYNGKPRNKTMEDVKDAIMETVYQEQLPYKVEEVKTTLNCIARDMDGQAVARIFDNIAFDPKYVDQKTKFLRALHKHFDIEEDFEIFDTLMSHWAWVCKRRMLGRQVKWHIWPNYYGPTGGGKTTTICKLCAPFEDYVAVTDIATLFDSTREVAKLSEYSVLVFDELSVNGGEEGGGSLTEDNKATLKSILTKDYIDVRVYGTQRQSKQRITFVPISSANYHLYDIIFDPTSMRRFFEFHCKSKPTDFTEINKYLDKSWAFWRGIDENIDEGYWDPNNAIGQAIAKIQSEYYPTRSTTTMWIKACSVKAGNRAGSGAYRAYCHWCRETGNKSRTMQNWVADIKHVIPEACRNDGKVFLSYTSGDEEDEEPLRMPEPASSPENLEELF